MEKHRPPPLGYRSELQQQLQLLGDVLKPFLTLKTASEIGQWYRQAENKIDKRTQSMREYHENSLWYQGLTIFRERIYNVIEARRDSLYDKAFAEDSTAVILDDYRYNHELMLLSIEVLYALEKIENVEQTGFFEIDVPDSEGVAENLAGHFVYFLLFLFAVPQPEELEKAEKNKDFANKDWAWRMLGPCKFYQDNTAFMDLVRNFSVIIMFVYGEDIKRLHVPEEVLDICKYYAKLAREDKHARIFERGILHKIKQNKHTLTEDEVEKITDIAKYKQTQSHTAIRALLSRLRQMDL